MHALFIQVIFNKVRTGSSVEFIFFNLENDALSFFGLLISFVKLRFRFNFSSFDFSHQVEKHRVAHHMRTQQPRPKVVWPGASAPREALALFAHIFNKS